jgi:hypothetical protein
LVGLRGDYVQSARSSPAPPTLVSHLANLFDRFFGILSREFGELLVPFGALVCLNPIAEWCSGHRCGGSSRDVTRLLYGQDLSIVARVCAFTIGVRAPTGSSPSPEYHRGLGALRRRIASGTFSTARLRLEPRRFLEDRRHCVWERWMHLIKSEEPSPSA